MTAKLDKREIAKAQQLQLLMSIAKKLHIAYDYSWEDGNINFHPKTSAQNVELMCEIGKYGKLID